MMKLCYLVTLAMAVGVAALPSPYSFAADAGQNVVRLVSAMRADYSELLKLRLATQWAVRDGQAKPQLLECVKSLDNSSFTPVFAKTFQDALTSEEIGDAIAFFEGPLGQKVISRRLALTFRAAGGSYPEPVEPYSETDVRELRAIAKRSWGEKLLRYTVTDQPAHRKAVDEKTDELLKTCQGR